MWSSGAEEENYCADFCDPSPCTGDDTCTLEDQDQCDTTSSPCPPVATCAASLVAADEEVEVDEEAQVGGLLWTGGSNILLCSVESSSVVT